MLALSANEQTNNNNVARTFAFRMEGLEMKLGEMKRPESRLLSRRLLLDLLALGGRADSPQQLFHTRRVAILFVIEHRHVVDEHDQIAHMAGFNRGLHAESRFRCFLEADGLAAQVHSEETTLNFNSHELILSFLVQACRS